MASRNVLFIGVVVLGIAAALALRNCSARHDPAKSEGFDRVKLAPPASPPSLRAPGSTADGHGARSNNAVSAREPEVPAARVRVVTADGTGVGGVAIRFRDYRERLPDVVAHTDGNGYASLGGSIVGRYCVPNLLSSDWVLLSPGPIVLTDGLTLRADVGCHLVLRLDTDDPMPYRGRLCEFSVDNRVSRVVVQGPQTPLGVFRGGTARLLRVGRDYPDARVAAVSLPLRGEAFLTFRSDPDSYPVVRTKLWDDLGTDFRLRLMPSPQRWYSPSAHIKDGYATFRARAGEYAYVALSGGRSAAGLLRVEERGGSQHWEPAWLASVSVLAASRYGGITSADLYIRPSEMTDRAPWLAPRALQQEFSSQFEVWDDQVPNPALRWLGAAEIDDEIATWTGIPSGATALVVLRGEGWSARSQPVTVAEWGTTVVSVQRVPTLTILLAGAESARVSARPISSDGAVGYPTVVGETAAGPVSLSNHSTHERLQVVAASKQGADVFEWHARADATHTLSPLHDMVECAVIVLDYQGEPIAGVPVAAIADQQSDQDGTTDSEGRVSFSALPGAQLRANVLGPSYRSASVPLHEGELTALQASPLHTVTVANTGESMTSVRIEIDPPKGSFDILPFRFETGTVTRITHLPPGQYRIMLKEKTGGSWKANFSRNVNLGEGAPELVALSIP